MLRLHLHSGRRVNIVAHKKIVYVIVEGPSDDEALEMILTRLFKKNAVHVEIYHGDITTDDGVDAGNIVAKIGDLVKRYANSYHFKQSDFKQVIHLLDMDGAYIPDEAVKGDSSKKHAFYTTSEILTAYPDRIRERNHRKCKNLGRLYGLNAVWGKIPYEAYYMSANLDHVLYNKLNTSDEEKAINSMAFARRYKDHLCEFLTFISDSDFAVCTTRRDSWDFIKQDLHSLERHTNLGICFKEIRRLYCEKA